MRFPTGRLSCPLKFQKNIYCGSEYISATFLRSGSRVGSAIINSTLEADFLRQAQKFPDVADRSYWIGGSTNAGHLQNFEFSDYKTDDDGNILLYNKVS